MTFMALIRIFHLAMAGQRICQAMARAKDVLQNYQVLVGQNSVACDIYNQLSLLLSLYVLLYTFSVFVYLSFSLYLFPTGPSPSLSI
jgi:hypothetical protein